MNKLTIIIGVMLIASLASNGWQFHQAQAQQQKLEKYAQELDTVRSTLEDLARAQQDTAQENQEILKLTKQALEAARESLIDKENELQKYKAVYDKAMETLYNQAATNAAPLN